MLISLCLFLNLALSVVSCTSNKKYFPRWSSLDARPIPLWYQKAKFGIFCHWGVYSVPAFKSEWFWWDWKGTHPDPSVVEYVTKTFRPGTNYADFASEFNGDLFDAMTFKDIVESSGARYIVFTSKHHDGFTMWPSETSWNWNSVDIGPHRDIVGELKKAFNNSSIHIGLYFSQLEWFNRYYLSDRLFNTTNYVKYISLPQMVEIVTRYLPEIIWSDGDWTMSEDYWKSKHFLAWLYNDSPVKDYVVVNDRWGIGTMGKHGGFFTYGDHYDPGHLVDRKWENCLSMDKQSWGNRRDMRSTQVYTVEELVTQLVRTISCNGNFLLNIGPDKYGMIPAIFEERLRKLGQWVKRNEEAIFDSYPWMYQNDSQDIWYTISVPTDMKFKKKVSWLPHTNETKLYVFIMKFPTAGLILLPSVHYREKTEAEVLLDDGHTEKISVSGTPGKPLTLNFRRHNILAAYGQIVVRIKHFDAVYRNPIEALKSRNHLLKMNE